ncbi:MAG: hypothetical protein HOP11_14370 [Saprospiraceae bacterium]|nr:hypothetical protein [Saprospiraceae bacterium]
MPGQKFLRNLSGKIKELEAIQTSSGVGDAGKIPALDAAGVFDISLLPAGVGADVTVVTSSEALSAGDFTNYHDSSGIKVRKADASSNAKSATGFVLSSVSNGASATVYPISSKNTAVSGLTVGAEYFLGTTPGTITTTAPSAANQIVQLIGRATSATAIIFSNASYYELS